MENSRITQDFGFARTPKFKTWQQDKGCVIKFAAFVDRVSSGGSLLIPLRELVNVTLTSIATVTSAREGRQIVLETDCGVFYLQ